MKAYSVSVALAIVLLIAGACAAQSTPEPDLEGTVQAAVQATLDAQPTKTPAPDLQATVAAAVEATVSAQETASAQQNASAQPTSLPSNTPAVASAGDRLYRSYPAPTGYPAFRKYYQKRCYPGCHYDATEGTPASQVVHP